MGTFNVAGGQAAVPGTDDDGARRQRHAGRGAPHAQAFGLALVQLVRRGPPGTLPGGPCCVRVPRIFTPPVRSHQDLAVDPRSLSACRGPRVVTAIQSFFVSLDLLVFGPHPDDIEIGLGATVAQARRDGHAGRALRSHAGRAGQQRHRRGSPARGGRRREGARRRVAREPAAGRTAASRTRRSSSARRSEFIRRHASRRRSRFPYWKDRHPDHVAASDVLTLAAFQSGLRRYETRRRRLAPRLGLLLLHQRRRHAVVRRRRLGRTTRRSATRWPASAASSRRPATARSRRG